MVLITVGIVLLAITFLYFGFVQKTGPYDEYYIGRNVTICTWEINKKHLWCLIPIVIIIIGFILK